MNNDLLRFNKTFNTFVDSVIAVDDLMVNVNFKVPAPRFKFDVLTLKFDTGMPIVPDHGF